jgi:hypothetical protein
MCVGAVMPRLGEVEAMRIQGRLKAFVYGSMHKVYAARVLAQSKEGDVIACAACMNKKAAILLSEDASNTRTWTAHKKANDPLSSSLSHRHRHHHRSSPRYVYTHDKVKVNQEEDNPFSCTPHVLIYIHFT